ncbi:endonuclease III domain-containing protein [Desulforhopalus singaporensis]|uniref:DNA-3-methyladenine glycosylase III n=1 Tax=Desulforhopalus singaporensis TaxID=91360 RepID=A0A1H0NFX9_9BACT|nr:endonuclease [Desulforhopalus singaporensis]SDO91662.1 DNA-3-methyladenine glycosylase III [Desulforhopalus singaporensis]
MSTVYHDIYTLLYDHFGPQHWWPGESPFEVMVGAVLTQNTNWSNVAAAIENLKDSGLLSYERLSRLTADEIAPLIRPSGYYNRKAVRLKNLLDMIGENYHDSLDCFLGDSLGKSRQMLLGVKGIGPETADSILLYCCGHPVFVVDAYTHRVFSRHNLADEETDYHTLQSLFVDRLPEDVKLYNEYHALIVKVASTYCKKNNPLCDRCPLHGVNG